VVMQGYGATECGVGLGHEPARPRPRDRGRTIPPVQVKLADDGEILVSGPTLFSGYWRDPATTAASFTPDGWYRTGDIGRHDAAGHLILMGRKKDIIVLPNGLNVYPRTSRTPSGPPASATRWWSRPEAGRIEAVVLAPGAPVLPSPASRPTPRAPRRSAIRRGPGRDRRGGQGREPTLAVHQRVAAWRLWPDADFPRTHTFKVQRDRVRAWAVIDEPLPVREEGPHSRRAAGRAREGGARRSLRDAALRDHLPDKIGISPEARPCGGRRAGGRAGGRRSGRRCGRR
jgi:long-chain acyl-CoA synthetase